VHLGEIIFSAPRGGDVLVHLGEVMF
jgi:hypothetical protein